MSVKKQTVLLDGYPLSWTIWIGVVADESRHGKQFEVASGLTAKRAEEIRETLLDSAIAEARVEIAEQ